MARELGWYIFFNDISNILWLSIHVIYKKKQLWYNPIDKLLI